MMFSLRVTSSNISFGDRRAIHAAMAKRYQQIVQGNFGPNGMHRPAPWAPLSPSYVKQNIRKDRKTPTYVGTAATLFRTGKLFNSIKWNATESQGTVWTADKIASYHQFGTDRMPARPFFPFYADGTPTKFAVDEVTFAAEKAIP